MTDKNGGFLMFVSVSELFTDVLKWNNDGIFPFSPKDAYFIVCSRDICTDMLRTNSSHSYGVSNEYHSKYRNVEFVMSLLPTPQQMEFVTTSGLDEFAADYMERLFGEYPMKDILCICDIVANRGNPVFVVCSRMDFDFQFPYVLRDFIKNEFGLHGFMLDEIAIEHIDEVYQIGNLEDIKKSIQEHIDALLRQTDKDYFINELAEDMEKAYRTMLNNRTEEELKQIADEYGLFVSKRDTKERIIDKIVAEVTR